MRRWSLLAFVLVCAGQPAVGLSAGEQAGPPAGGTVAASPASTPAQTDGRVELFLREARVVRAKKIGTGITRPMKLYLELDGDQGKAAFKYVDEFQPGMKRRADGGVEWNFIDSYRFERAAYLLDRELGLNMVPVTVLREWKGRTGAAIDWISDAVNEKERREQGIDPPEAVGLERQRALMRLFDVLILNVDRNLTNQLITRRDGRLHLIDHSRSFRLARELPPDFLARPVSVPEELIARLGALKQERLKRLLGGLVSKERLRALLARRDAILKKIHRDRETYGDALVLQDPAS